jgi:hypothetical protein
MPETKKCKHCQSEIDKKAKICPNCRKKQGGKLKFIVIGAIALILIYAAVNGGGNDSSTESVSSDNVKSETSNDANSSNDAKKDEAKKAKSTDKPIEYTKYDVSEMMDDLNSNAMKAEKKYSDQYVEITGKLSNIDSDGKYIDLVSSKDEFAILGVQCYIKSDDQSSKVMEMEKDQTVTLKGKITSVGEVMGFSLDIAEIE